MYITINGKKYSEDVADFFREYNPAVAAVKHRTELMRAARKVRELKPYRCSKCGAVVSSLEPVRWCPVGEHFMSQPKERLSAAWRVVAP